MVAFALGLWGETLGEAAVRFGLRLPSYAWKDLTYERAIALGDYAQKAEDEGFESLWALEHLLVAPAIYGTSWLDPLQVLAFVAARTKRALVGTGILVLPLRHPVITAKAVATLDYLSGGRFVLGIGAGWDEAEFEAVGVRLKERGARTDECLEALRRLLTEERVTHRGRFYQFDDVSIDPRPPRMPPVWVAGGSLGHAPEAPDRPYIAESVLRRLLRADAWLSRSSGSDASMVKADWVVVQDYLRSHGRDPRGLIFGHTQFVHISEKADRAAAWEEQSPHFLRVMGDHRTVEELAASYMLGTVDDIQRRVADLAEAGLQYLLLTPVSDDPRQIGLLRKHVTEVFRGN